jgi:hypothetical protein
MNKQNKKRKENGLGMSAFLRERERVLITEGCGYRKCLYFGGSERTF